MYSRTYVASAAVAAIAVRNNWADGYSAALIRATPEFYEADPELVTEFIEVLKEGKDVFPLYGTDANNVPDADGAVCVRAAIVRGGDIRLLPPSCVVTVVTTEECALYYRALAAYYGIPLWVVVEDDPEGLKVLQEQRFLMKPAEE